MSAEIIALPKRKPDTWETVSDNMVLHKPTGIYYVRKFKTGRGRLFKTTGEKRKARAQSIADEMVAKWMGGDPKKAAARKQVRDVLDDLDAALEKEAASYSKAGIPERGRTTREKDKYMLRAVKEHFGDCWLDEIDEQFWADWMRTTGKSLGTNLGEIAKYLSKVMTFAYQRRAINRKPQIKNPDPEPAAKPVYRKEDIHVFLEHAEPDLFDMIVIGAECGLRPHENSELRWEWVTFTDVGVRVALPATFTKTRTAREIYLSAGAASVVKRRAKHLKVTPGEPHRDPTVTPFVFPAPRDPMSPMSKKHRCKMWRRMLKAAGLKPGIKFHWLRHTFFSEALLVAGKDLKKVAAYGGNSPKVLFKDYMDKDAKRTIDVAGSLDLGLTEPTKTTKQGRRPGRKK